MKPFRIALSIEKDPAAWRTLRLRAFFRQFANGSSGEGRRNVPEDYYRYLRGELTEEILFSLHRKAAEAAEAEAWNAELGAAKPGHDAVRDRIAISLHRGGVHEESDPWVLIGGPPCQPFSLAGRSRNKGKADYTLETDPRHELYREYLRVIADHAPPVFVMENVKGMLSAKVDGVALFARVLQDLSDPMRAVNRASRQAKPRKYRLLSLTQPFPEDLWDADSSVNLAPKDYVVRTELFGIPQTRHRVIILGVREDFATNAPQLLKPRPTTPIEYVIDGLPRLRSGLTGSPDSKDTWIALLNEQRRSEWVRSLNSDRDVRDEVVSVLEKLSRPQHDRGDEYVPCEVDVEFEPRWYLDDRIRGIVNHASRGHMSSDLNRYLFAACFGKVHGRSPELSDFPKELLPDHANARAALGGSLFADRFRVQVRGRPATTVVSHIAKDGHYYIHPDPSQCRSLTVREAARIQTFPDNYLFVGNRTSQFTQVGNAVPPLLAREIASVVRELLGPSR